MKKKIPHAPLPKVGIIGGSKSDFPILEKAQSQLKSLNISSELKVVSAHRTPNQMFQYAENAFGRGIEVIIAGAGGAAHLPGMIAAKTEIPVIGIPIPTEYLNGIDSLLSIVQMPRGIPVATVAIGNGENAAILAAEILALKYPEIRKNLLVFRAKQTQHVLDQNQ
jgi:5-(carboxyamino)imidazole ribonucleotide mutase